MQIWHTNFYFNNIGFLWIYSLRKKKVRFKDSPGFEYLKKKKRNLQPTDYLKTN